MIKNALIQTTNATMLDCTHFETTTDIEIESAEPANTTTRYLMRISGEKWRAFKEGAWAFASSRDLTADIVLNEGNTKAELLALTSTELAIFAGNKIEIAVAHRIDTGTDLPSISKFRLNGTNSQIKKDFVYSDVIKLGDDAVGIADIDITQSARNGGAVTVYASVKDSAGDWSDYKTCDKVSGSGSAIRFKAEVEVDKPNVSVAELESVKIQHLTDSKSGSIEGKSVLVTEPIVLADEVSRAHALIRHSATEDTDFNVSIVFGTSDEFQAMNRTSKRERNGIVEEDYEYIVTDDTKSNTVMLKVEIDQQQGTVTDEVLGTGTGKQQTFKLPHNARQESIQVTAGDESTYYYKPKTKTLFVTAKTGEEIKISYDWIAETSYLTALACVFNQ